MIAENILLLACLSLLILLNFLHPCRANQKNNPYYCSPSACGLIHNISFPFRLKDDPEHCGDSNYELACENNVTSVYLDSQKYHVKAINYPNLTIWLADASIKNDTCSFPKYSVYAYPYYNTFGKGFNNKVALPINFMSCPSPLKNSSFLTEITDCVNGDNILDASNSSNGRYSYIKVGEMMASEVKYMCRVDLIVLTSWKLKDLKNVSLSEIHDSLLYGFELSWSFGSCSKCRGYSICDISEDNLVTCYGGTAFRYKLYSVLRKIGRYLIGREGLILILMLITVFLFAAASLAAMIIIGFACVFGLLIIITRGLTFNEAENTFQQYFGLIIGLIIAARFIIIFSSLMGLLIYKFRRRHLSMFDAIEEFLQSDNKLMPIRYSYTDIKKMTRGFREKLGEGGYGSVYKGKLRSGNYVAVKLLRKTGGNGQDFMNEIATIGRIHHVNVVKLVGYCADRSKCALIFDFMLNGSLEKYIFSQDKMNSLNWDKKYEISVGVARGIEYLHRGCDIQILHFDIKPHNILLDEKFIPKISDFGLAKFCSTDKNTVTLTAARGTIGYVAPELINRGIGGISYKADVYSFGMLLMEMVGLKRALIVNNENSNQYFPYWIYDCFNQGKNIEFRKADENDADDNDSTRKIARKMTIVALWCIQMSPGDRPSMNKVLEMLEGEVEHLQIPPQPSVSPQVVINDDQTWTTALSTDSLSLLSHDAAPIVEITIQNL